MKRPSFLLFLLLLLGGTSIHAQDKTEKRDKKERTIALWGHVKNSFTKVGIPDVKITLMRADSTVVDTMTVWTHSYNSTKLDASYRFYVPAVPGRYIIRAVHPEYETCYVDYEIKRIARNTYFDAPHHLMRRRDPQRDLEQMLDEVQVKASKVKIAYKGDTIVYNADAFNLPEGSMLDALIRQLPGVELSDDGVIKVNGKQVDYLTLNGKDFFKGKNKVMLDNLPYYTVKEVRTYHKSTEMSEWMGREVEQKDYVMDVTLKREYSKGYLANVGVGGGTEDRYQGRFFGLRYTDNSRLSAFGNINNVNEFRKPGEKGEWNPTNIPQGQLVTKHAGIDLMIDDKEKRFLEKGFVEMKHTDNTTLLQTAGESFLSTGNSYSRSYSNSRSKSLELTAHNDFTWKWSQEFRLYISLYGSYNKSEGNGRNISGTFNADPSAFGGTMQIIDSLYATCLNPELQRMALNRQRSVSQSDGSSLDTRWYITLTNKLKNGDNYTVAFNGDAGNRKQKQYALSQYDFLQEEGDESNDRRNQYITTPSSNYRYNPWVNYQIHWLNDWNLGFTYGYQQTYNSNTNGIYRLDRLNGWETDELHTIGMLPSTRDSLLMSIDAGNSYRYNQHERWHHVQFIPYYLKQAEGEYTHLEISLPVRHISQQLNYHGASLDTCVSQRNWDFDPSIRFNRYTHNYARGFGFDYSMEMSQPSLYDQLDITNDQNPLNIRKGNPNLKGSTAHRMQTYVMLRNSERQQYFNFTYGLRFFLNQVAQGYTFNPTTGAYTYMPENVDGNWQTYIWTTFGRAIDRQKRWRWSTTTHADYTRNVDLTAVEGETASALSKVDNWYVNEQLSLDYQFGKLRAGVNGSIAWRYATGSQRETQEVNALDFDYGFTCTYELPWSITFATDLKMFSRRGYGDSSMNTDDLVWNASLSRPWLNGKLTSRLEGFDLFDQVSGNSIAINGQGRTETHRNALPRYVMLHLAYHFSLMPKKR